MGGAASHWGFIIASYAVTALVLGGLVASIVIDLRRQRRLLAELEAAGARRRRAGTAAREDTPR